MIKLKNGFYVKSDGLQFLLCTNRESTNKTTNENYNREETLADCGNMAQVLNSYCKETILKKVAEEDMELKDVLKAIKELKEEIKSYL